MAIKIAIRVAYFNTLNKVFGFQIQPNVVTIEGLLTKAIIKSGLVDLKKFKLDYAGRTDHGVNAIAQLISFLLADKFQVIPTRLLHRINSHLSKNIRCWAYAAVEVDFSPRFSATERTYLYIWREPEGKTLDLDFMKTAAQRLIGTHNFRNFSKSDDQKNTIRRLNSIKITQEQQNSSYLFLIKGQSFLWQQCRRIVSHLTEIGRSDIDQVTTVKLLEDNTNLKRPGPLPPENLTLIDISYKPNISFLVEKGIIKKITQDLRTQINFTNIKLSFLDNYYKMLTKNLN